MKIKKIVFILSALLLISVSPIFVSVANAMTPTLSISTSGQAGDYVQITVNGDSNATGVNLFVGSQAIIPLPALNSSGTMTTTIGSAQSENQYFTIPSNATVYVKTGGINGLQSSSVSWPYLQNSSTTSTLTLSQGAIILNAGQNSTITANANYLYLLTNSNPAVANLNFNASQITVQALTYGSTVANVCVVGSTTNCATISITVQNSSAQQLTFSQNNFSIVSGQSSTVTIYGGSGSYAVTNNSNSNSISTSLNGSTITLTATSTVGASSITVCTADINYCGIINVNSTASNSTAVTFSQTNPAVAIGQNTTVTIYGGSGNNFYVSSNSSPSAVQANISSNILTLIGIANGTSTISICAYAGSCGTLTANISSTANSGGPISLSQATVSILAGQSSNITISGGSAPYSISNPSTANIFNGNISGNILTIYGVSAGSANVSICASIGCTTLYVTINSTTTTINPPVFSQNNVLVNVGQNTTVYVTGTGSYYISNNSNSSIASEQINGNSISITGIVAGSTNVSICQNGGQCATLYITVSSVVPTSINVITSTTLTFNRYMGVGDKGDDVLALQKILVKQKFLSATPNGNYGPATFAAVKKFQKDNKIKQTGNVGPATKDVLNKISGSVISESTGDQQQILSLEQTMKELQAKIASMSATVK